jgi:hypothetical protein
MELNDESIIELEASSTTRLDKSVPGARWSAQRGLWLLPLSWASCTVARSALGAELEVGPKLTEWSRDEYESRVLPATVAREAEDGPGFTPAEFGDPDDEAGFAGVDGYEGRQYARQAYGTEEETLEKAWWADIWRGMPEYLHHDLSAKRRLIVNFSSDADVQEFARRIGQRVGPRESSIHFPEEEVVHEIDWRYTDEDDPDVGVPDRPGQLRRGGRSETIRTIGAPKKRVAKPKLADNSGAWATVLETLT